MNEGVFKSLFVWNSRYSQSALPTPGHNHWHSYTHEWINCEFIEGQAIDQYPYCRYKWKFSTGALRQLSWLTHPCIFHGTLFSYQSARECDEPGRTLRPRACDVDVGLTLQFSQ